MNYQIKILTHTISIEKGSIYFCDEPEPRNDDP